MVYIVLSIRPLVTTKARNDFNLWKKFSGNHDHAHPNLSQKRQKLFQLWHNRVDSSLVDTVNQNFISHSFSIFTILIYSQTIWFFQPPMTVLNSLLNLDQIQLLWLKTIFPRNDNKFPRKPSGSFGLVVVSMIGIFEQASSASPNYSLTARDLGDAGWNTFICGRTWHGHKRVSGGRKAGYRGSLGGSWLKHGCSAFFQPGIDTPFFPLSFNGLQMD